MGLGVDGEPMVYLDVRPPRPHLLERRVGGVLEDHEKFVGEDPKKGSR
jgi:succinate dehydrogenase / fumarate reductase flavoprotein subunit